MMEVTLAMLYPKVTIFISLFMCFMASISLSFQPSVGPLKIKFHSIPFRTMAIQKMESAEHITLPILFKIPQVLKDAFGHVWIMREWAGSCDAFVFTWEFICWLVVCLISVFSFFF
jgi:hypothetical protein